MRMSRVKVWAIFALVGCVVAGASWKIARARAASNAIVVNAKEPVEMVRLRKALHAEAAADRVDQLRPQTLRRSQRRRLPAVRGPARQRQGGVNSTAFPATTAGDARSRPS